MKKKLKAAALVVSAALCAALGFASCETDDRLTATEQQTIMIEASIEDLKIVDETLQAYIDSLRENMALLDGTTQSINALIGDLLLTDAYLSEQIACLEADSDNLLSRYEAVQETINGIRSSIETVNDDLAKLDEKVTADLAAAIEKSEKSIGETIKALDARIRKNETDIKEILKRLDALEKENAELKNKIECLRGAHEYGADTMTYRWNDDLSVCTVECACVHCERVDEFSSREVYYENGALIAEFSENGVEIPSDRLNLNDLSELNNAQIEAAVRYMVDNGGDGETNITLTLPERCDGVFSGIKTSLSRAAVGTINLTLLGVKEIEDRAINSLDSLLTLTIGEGVTKIGEEAFVWCDRLKEVTVGDDVTTIGRFAFNANKSLSVLTLGSGVTSIGEAAFGDCALTSLRLPKGITTIENNFFGSCSALKEIAFAAPLEQVEETSFNGLNTSAICLYLAEGQKAMTPNESGVFVPTKETFLSGDEFCGKSFKKVAVSVEIDARSLKSASLRSRLNTVLQDGYTHISVLFSSDALDSLGNNLIWTVGDTIQKSSAADGSIYLTLIGAAEVDDSCFTKCTRLKSVCIGDGVRTIGHQTFFGCSNLESVSFGTEVTCIESYAFGLCTSLKTIVFDGTTEQWNAIEKGDNWNYGISFLEIVCNDGTINVD